MERALFYLRLYFKMLRHSCYFAEVFGCFFFFFPSKTACYLDLWLLRLGDFRGEVWQLPAYWSLSARYGPALRRLPFAHRLASGRCRMFARWLRFITLDLCKKLAPPQPLPAPPQNLLWPRRVRDLQPPLARARASSGPGTRACARLALAPPSPRPHPAADPALSLQPLFSLSVQPPPHLC